MYTQREFVQIPERQLVDVTLKFATGLKREGQFGSYQVYTVLHDGEEKALKVSDRLEKQFRKLDVKAGETLSLLKETIVPQKGEPFTVINVLERKNGSPPPTPKPQSLPQKETPPVQPEKPTNGTHPPTPSHEGFSGDTGIMYESLVDAVDITRTIEGVEWRNTDIEKIGVCLFLSRTGHLSVEQVLANGNGNGNGKRTRRSKKCESEKPAPNAASVIDPSKHLVPIVEEAVTEKNDLPF